MGIKPTFYDFTLNDDSVVQVTRNYAGLYMLKAQRPDIYEKSQIYNKSNKTDEIDDIETAEVIYAAYVTACLVNNSVKKANGIEEDRIMEEEEFLALMPTNAHAIKNILNKLYVGEKKRADSQKHFKEQQEKGKGRG